MGESTAGAAVTQHAPAAQSAAERVGRSLTVVPRTYDEMGMVANMLYKSQLLPKAIRSPEAAFAIIVAGAELGMPPMLALRGINLVDGKVVIAADLQLGAFKRAGGKAIFSEFTDKRCTLQLVHPNGDTHIETFSMEDAKLAGLLGKDNWKKYPKAMLRSRVITAGLKSIGFEPVAGAYDPDEAAGFAPSEQVPLFERQAALNAGASVSETDALDIVDDGSSAGRVPFGPLKDKRYDERDADGKYLASTKFVQEVLVYSEKKLLESQQKNDAPAQERFSFYAEEAQRELDRRLEEEDKLTATHPDKGGASVTDAAATVAAQ